MRKGYFFIENFQLSSNIKIYCKNIFSPLLYLSILLSVIT